MRWGKRRRRGHVVGPREVYITKRGVLTFLLMIVLERATAVQRCFHCRIRGDRPEDVSVEGPGGPSAGTDFEETRADQDRAADIVGTRHKTERHDELQLQTCEGKHRRRR
ncbi:hypothetical protein L227DRAFT_188974 [Lentinus tigrinus ALCF2SS1-6]|uniref:Uncharacterized protein n=1 Tax=Lentinus tigrinus ALCF2SS1-6 TaxID=1328759 RepID=A0A5C2S4I6_9APHY|nr:hypothetical protein L227DRAFT_188974 [Lentinus tigrinus ALCF2SS1-6]